MTEFLFEKNDEYQGRITELTTLNNSYSHLEVELENKQNAFNEELRDKVQRLEFYQNQTHDLESQNENLRKKERELQQKNAELQTNLM